MNFFLMLAYLFFIGSTVGWCMELLFRGLVSRRKEARRWINPGFCTGPYLPIYGFGLCILFLIASTESLLPFQNTLGNKVLLFSIMAVTMTVIEYIAGLFILKYYHVRLWDYSNQWGNVQGIICPLFSFFWAVLGAIYYFCIHPYILEGLRWLSQNLAFSFVIGLFFGVFSVDVAHSLDLIQKLKEFADKNELVLKYEAVKDAIHSYQQRTKRKYSFFSPFQSDRPLGEHLKEMLESVEERLDKGKDRTNPENTQMSLSMKKSTRNVLVGTGAVAAAISAVAATSRAVMKKLVGIAQWTAHCRIIRRNKSPGSLDQKQISIPIHWESVLETLDISRRSIR